MRVKRMSYNEEYAKQGLDPMCLEPQRYGRMVNMNESNTKNSHLKECVYGPEIKNPCPIRAILESTRTEKEKEKEEVKEVLEKALGAQMPPQLQAFFNPLQSMFETISNKTDMASLANFCRCCPFLQKHGLDLMYH